MTEPDELGIIVAEKDIPLATKLNLIKRRTERGLTPIQIARIMDMAEIDVQTIVKTNGWTPKREISQEQNELDSKDAARNKRRDEMANLIRKLAERGMSRQDVADITGKSRTKVNETARTYGIKFEADQRDRREKRQIQAKYRSKEFYEEVVTLRAKGWSILGIGRELGVSRATVKKCIEHFQKGGKA